MLIVKHGDVFKQGLDVIMHQANCRATMGSGIADTVRREYPEAYLEDVNYDKPVGGERLGLYSWAWVAEDTFRIFNLYGQDNYKGRGIKTKYDKLEESLRRVMGRLSNKLVGGGLEELKIGIPYGLGCVRAGGDWGAVRDIFNRVSEEYGVTIYAYKMEGK